MLNKLQIDHQVASVDLHQDDLFCASAEASNSQTIFSQYDLDGISHVQRMEVKDHGILNAASDIFDPILKWFQKYQCLIHWY